MEETEEWQEFLADVQKMDNEELKYQLIMYADNGYDGEYLAVLLDRGVDVNTVNRRGATALLCAAACENVSAVRLLLERGADPNIFDNCDDSALGYAALFGHKEITQLLIDAGADLEVINDEDRSILHQALHRADDNEDSVHVIELLIEAGVDTTILFRGTTPIEIASKLKRQDIQALFKSNEQNKPRK